MLHESHMRAFKHSQAVSLRGKQSKTKGVKSTEQLNLSTTE